MENSAGGKFANHIVGTCDARIDGKSFCDIAKTPYLAAIRVSELNVAHESAVKERVEEAVSRLDYEKRYAEGALKVCENERDEAIETKAQAIREAEDRVWEECYKVVCAHCDPATGATPASFDGFGWHHEIKSAWRPGGEADLRFVQCKASAIRARRSKDKGK